MELAKEMLNHPFYQAWNDGEISQDQLAQYAVAYQEFMDRVPNYWNQVLDGLGIDEEQGDEVVVEETEHSELWRQWRVQLPAKEDAPMLSDLFNALEEMSASELAGALHAYEVQQPDVADTKREGLVDHYGFSADNLDFFDEHAENEDDHIAFGQKIRNRYADTEAFDRGFKIGSTLFFHSLDAFV